MIVPEAPPDTILVPSGENCTELMLYGSAPLFSVLRSSVAARQASKRQFRPRRSDLRPNTHPNPIL